jgi:hypothetical protein
MVKRPDPITKLQAEREKKHKTAEDHKHKHHEPSHRSAAKKSPAKKASRKT